MTEKSGIYAIRHLESGRAYVGSAANISKRWHIHRKTLRLQKHTNTHLQAAWSKYGEAAFVFEILEFTDELEVREQHWINALDAFKSGFNLCPIARSSRNRFVSEIEKQVRRVILDTKARPKALTAQAIGRRVATRRKEGTLGKKLTWAQVCEIRCKYGTSSTYGKGRKQRRNGGVTLQALADEYGVGTLTIYDVVNWKSWKTDPESTLIIS